MSNTMFYLTAYKMSTCGGTSEARSRRDYLLRTRHRHSGYPIGARYASKSSHGAL